ncbi:MAG: helix-turn-helix transcriptional regulator [Hormoscilla sp. GUM202]|nr:helix-turn-helix transcriptional regulator [Hormoscilla sp. GUM202]MBO1350953.1 helix-turn-helix transcriptional regulator [Hormoscilla sp. GUM202]
MKINDIYEFFLEPPPIYLNKELAVCYILSVLLGADSYGTELMGLLEKRYPIYWLSDTVLYSSLKFLEEEQLITGYWQKLTGRGRPRRMYHIRSQWRQQAKDLARLWQDYVAIKSDRILLLRQSYLECSSAAPSKLPATRSTRDRSLLL